MIGMALGYYRVAEALGAGGRGGPFVAHDTELNRKAAIETLPASVVADVDRRERFAAREARAVAALSHPNIVTVHSVEEAVETYVPAVEMVEDRTSADLIPARGLPPDRSLKLAIPLAAAVSAAHARGIARHDLKPANLMVTTDEQNTAPGMGVRSAIDRVARPERVLMVQQPLAISCRLPRAVSGSTPRRPTSAFPRPIAQPPRRISSNLGHGAEVLSLTSEVDRNDQKTCSS
jgi:serine/threonine protein kinase